jgi:hypothetical protein
MSRPAQRRYAIPDSLIDRQLGWRWSLCLLLNGPLDENRLRRLLGRLPTEDRTVGRREVVRESTDPRECFRYFGRTCAQ